MAEQDQYATWRKLLAGENVAAEQFVNPEDAFSGFFRIRNRDGSFDAVSIFRDDTGLHFVRAGREVEGDKVWPFCLKRPGGAVSYEVYEAVTERGEKWPDENIAVIGHNRVPVEDTPEAIDERIADLSREAERLIKSGAAQTQEAADQASDLANTLGELEAKAVKLHKVEKEPHLEAGRAVDRKWFPLRDKAAEIKALLKRVVVTPFLAKKDEEKRQRLAVEIAKGTPIEALPSIRTTAGSSKRSTGLRTYYRAEIEDKAKLLEALKDHPDLNACIQKIADAAAGKKVALPGCRVVTEQRAA